MAAASEDSSIRDKPSRFNVVTSLVSTVVLPGDSVVISPLLAHWDEIYALLLRATLAPDPRRPGELTPWTISSKILWDRQLASCRNPNISPQWSADHHDIVQKRLRDTVIDLSTASSCRSCRVLSI